MSTDGHGHLIVNTRGKAAKKSARVVHAKHIGIMTVQILQPKGQIA